VPERRVGLSPVVREEIKKEERDDKWNNCKNKLLMAYSEEDYYRNQAADRARQQELFYQDQLRQNKMAATDKARQAEAVKSDPGKEGEGSWRQRIAAARKKLDIKERAANKLKDTKIGQKAYEIFDLKSKVKNKILNAIPGYTLYLVLKKFVSSKKVKFDLVDIFIAIFSNIVALFYVIASLAIIILIVDFMQKSLWDKFLALLSTIYSLGWGAIQAIVTLFASY